MMDIEQRYIDLYTQIKSLFEENLLATSLAQRDAAMEQFAVLKFPGKHLEHYRYTSTSPLFEPELKLDINHEPIDIVLEKDFHCDIYDIDSYEVFIANGWVRKHAHQLPEGVIICSINEAKEQHAALYNKYVRQQIHSVDDGLVHLNTGLALDGIFLYVPPNTTVDKPIQLINVFKSEFNLLINQRNLFILDEGAQAKVLVRYHSLNAAHYVANVVNEIKAGRLSQLDVYCIQYVNNTTSLLLHNFIEQEAESHVLTNGITLNGGTVRNNTYVKLNGEYCESHTYGLALTEGKQHVDNYCKIDHAKPNCMSYELFKNILNDESTVAFCGHILVQKDAQKTNALQNNKNICLTPLAHVYSQPQLEIYADDVKCSHGATVGQLDEAALFFLRARGIPKKEAQLLLLSAFTHEAVDNVRIERLKIQLHDLIEKRFRGELSKCYSCPECNIHTN